MWRLLSLLLVPGVLLLLAACGDPLPTPSPVPAQTNLSPEALTATPPQSSDGSIEVSFSTYDAVPLIGTMYGSGAKAVVFAHMSDGTRADWGDVPRKVAGPGYRTLAFDFRGRGESKGRFDPKSAGDDVLAAIEFVRSRGAEQVVLAGASMGAMGAAKAAAVEDVDGLIFLAGTTSWSGLTVSDEEIAAIKAPKLFITSEGDTYVEGTQHLFDAASAPKEQHLYPGSLHGTQLFAAYGPDLEGRIIGFIRSSMP